MSDSVFPKDGLLREDLQNTTQPGGILKGLSLSSLSDCEFIRQGEGFLLTFIGQFPQLETILHECARQMPQALLVHFETLEEALGQLNIWTDEDPCPIQPACVLSDSLGDIDTAVKRLVNLKVFSHTHFALLTGREEHTDLSFCLSKGLLISIMSLIGMPPKPRVLSKQLATRVLSWAMAQNLNKKWVVELKERLDLKENMANAEFIQRLRMTSDDLVRMLLESVEQVLGKRTRLRIPPGVELTTQGQRTDAVYLVLEGSVSLHQESAEGSQVLLHHASSGPLIGLISFARMSEAVFTAKTTTEVIAVRLNTEQLARVLSLQPSVSALLAMAAMRSLTDRLIRAEQLHIEKETLANQLEIEHERSTRAAREQLKDARQELEEAAQFAMLGELAAGIAHELNNPSAAILRASTHVSQSVETMIDGMSDYAPAACHAAKILRKSIERAPLPPPEQRALVRALTTSLGERDLARRLVGMGLTDPEKAKALLEDQAAFKLTEQACTIGKSLRDIEVAARRITALVQSLRSYSRLDANPVPGVNIHEGLEDTLRLSEPKLRSITINRHYSPDLPEITCFPSRLEQVWTNLLMNAADALADTTPNPIIDITTSTVGDSQVRVKITDNGPGVPPELTDSIFLPHFTTKHGAVHYGLGMGLGMSRQIVEDHGGKIQLVPTDRGACFQVTLPVSGPPMLEGSTSTGDSRG